MRKAAFIVALLLGATPAFAQFGAIGEINKRANQVQKIADIKVSEKDERELGERVSATVRSEFGVLQDAALTKYVSLVGNVLAKASSRPDLKWEFIVLDTDGVNAFAAPGGLVHITRGALGLIKNEAELAGVLGHEISHITKKHSVKSIEKSKTTKLATEEAGAHTSGWFTMAADILYDNIIEKGWDRGDEDDADQEGVRLANKAGYNPAGLASFLEKLMERNKDFKGSKPNGLFATHPDTKDRIAKVNRQIKTEKLTAAAMGQPRYTENVKFDAKPVSAVALSKSDAKGVTGGGSAPPTTASKEPSKKEEKKSGGLLGGLTSKLSTGKQKESTQASASAGGRAVDPTRPDRYAAGGGNPNKLAVTVSAAELDAFRKGIA
jgi:beta-barrel assembly-enhancing protease